MAVGLGYMFGLRIPQNFNSPYKAVDPSDFWMRWHISLSSCLRDYLYIPMGGNRHGTWATYRNLIITMLIGGLWHGANWTFVIWGAYHGLLLVIYRLAGSWWDCLPRLLRQFGMFFLVMIGWVFFRADNLEIAGTMLETMFSYVPGTIMVHGEVFGFLVALALSFGMFGPNAFDSHINFRWNIRVAYAVSLFFGASLAIIMGGQQSPFLYFQF